MKKREVPPRLALLLLAALLLACSAQPLVEQVRPLTPRPAAPRLPGATTSPDTLPRASVFGFNSHLASCYPNFGRLEEPAAIAAGIEPGWVREELQWARVEPWQGSFDWSWYDTVFALHRQSGINIIGVINPAVGWATPEPSDGLDGISFYPPDPALFAAFARAAALRYRGVVRAWEIWNEPENAIFWRPAPDPAAYARLLIAASAEIKTVDPEVKVLNGGVVPYDPRFLDGIAAAGGWNAFDVLAVHPYVDPASPEDAQIDVVGVQNVARLAARYGAKPIWVTEYGWTTGPCERDPAGRTDEKAQASYVVRGAVLLRAAGAERVLWYTFKDETQPCYGLARVGRGLEDYGDLKPAAAALRTLSREIGAAMPIGARDLTPAQTILGFDDDRGWGTPFPPANGRLARSTEQVHGGAAAARIDYHFTTTGNDYVAFPRVADTPLPADTTRIALWVYGDGSGHLVQARIVDAEGEVLQYRLGFLGPPGWQLLSAPLGGPVEPGNRISAGNGRLDGALRLRELVVDDNVDAATGSGTIFVDDLLAYSGAAIYDQRFADGPDLVDVVWSTGKRTVELPVATSDVEIVDRDGARRPRDAGEGKISLDVGPAPVYVRQAGAAAQQP